MNVYYDKDGVESSEEKPGSSCACTQGKRHHIKKCCVGANGGHFIDPYGPLSKPGDLIAFDTQSGRLYYEYVEVEEGVFNQYIKFLQTRNPSYLRNAERDYNTSAKETYTHVSRK